MKWMLNGWTPKENGKIEYRFCTTDLERKKTIYASHEMEAREKLNSYLKEESK